MSKSPNSSTLMTAGKKPLPSASFIARWIHHQQKGGKGPAGSVLHRASNNAKPMVEVKAAALVVPTIRCRWKCAVPSRGAVDALDSDAARKRGEKSMASVWPTMAAAKPRMVAPSKARRSASHGGSQQGFRPKAVSRGFYRFRPIRGCSGKETVAVRHPSSAIATSAFLRTSTPARPRPPSASCSTPASITRSARCTGRRDDGLDGTGAGARHHHYVCRDDLLLEGMDMSFPSIASTSSTPRARRLHHRSRAFHARAGRRLHGYCAVGGVQPQSKPCGARPTKYKVPRLAFVNKMDRTGAELLKVSTR